MRSQKGITPKKGPDNEPVREGSVFEKLKGQPLTPGHTGSPTTRAGSVMLP